MTCQLTYLYMSGNCNMLTVNEKTLLKTNIHQEKKNGTIYDERKIIIIIENKLSEKVVFCVCALSSVLDQGDKIFQFSVFGLKIFHVIYDFACKNNAIKI